jgi:hypothetical protein
MTPNKATFDFATGSREGCTDGRNQAADSTKGACR